MPGRTSTEAWSDVSTPPRLDQLLEGSSRTFALTIPLLPEPTRCEVTVAYLLFRVADTLEDATLWERGKKVGELRSFSRLLAESDIPSAAGLAARWSQHPPCRHDGYEDLLAALPEVMEIYGGLSNKARRIVRRDVLRTIEGMGGFVAREEENVLRLRDLDDLKAYCYVVAGIVGEMLTELFVAGWSCLQSTGPALRRSAATFGEALQLVNILKDSNADATEGRNYLPPDVKRSDVFALARADLEVAFDYCRLLVGARAPRGLVAFNALPVLLARSTLTRVEESGPGSKLTRPEVGRIVSWLEDALDAADLSLAWNRV